MKMSELFKDSLKYPSTNWNNLLILGVLVLIANIIMVIPVFGISLNSIGFTGIALTIVSIISLIINFIIQGYSLDITKETINKIDILPKLNLKENLVNGVKVFLITVVYFIIPTILIIATAYLTGVFNSFMRIVLSGGVISDATAISLMSSILIVALVAIILFIIFGLIADIAIARFADKGNMGAAFEFGEIFDTIAKIGWSNYIIWFILLFVISFLVGLVMGLVMLIPIIGLIISLLFFTPYLAIFGSRALGLIYNEKDNL